MLGDLGWKARGIVSRVKKCAAAHVLLGCLLLPFSSVGRGLTLHDSYQVMDTKLYPTAAFPGPSTWDLTLHHTPEGIREHLMKSLKALKADKVDMWYLHGPDRTVPYDVTMKVRDCCVLQEMRSWLLIVAGCERPIQGRILHQTRHLQLHGVSPRCCNSLLGSANTSPFML